MSLDDESGRLQASGWSAIRRLGARFETWARAHLGRAGTERDQPTAEFNASVEEWLHRIVRAQLVDLGIRDAALTGIFAPAEGIDLADAGVTGQFLDRAEEYHAAYFQLDYWSSLLEGAFARIDGLRTTSCSTILDVGSGSGNTVFPLLQLCPRARVVASDISPQLLRILGSALRAQGHSDRAALVCLDLNKPWFEKGSFDLAVGGAILHHLFDPAKMIGELFDAVRPGGALVFFEPFELGYKLMAIAYREILETGRFRGGLEPEVGGFLERRLAEFELRSGSDKSRERLATVDDKWLFTRGYFETLARRLRASDLKIDPVQRPESMLENQIRFELKSGGGFVPEVLPPWAWELVDRTQNAFSVELRAETPIEGCITIRR